MKTNIAELLKDCPRGMELDCTLFEGLEFDSIVDNRFLPIRCRIKHPDGGYHVYNFTKYGCWSDMPFAKCVIFPKGKTTWEGFVPPCKFKDGDIVATNSESQVFILQRAESNTKGYCYIGYDFKDNEFFDAGVWEFERLATEEEKQKLFDAIKENGYKWNAETKTLEKLVEPNFKAGDRIRHKTHIRQENVVTEIKDTHYILDDELALPFISQDEYELVPNKFDIDTLKAFKSIVLVRDYDNRMWIPTFWCKRLEDDSNCIYLTTNGCYKYCIPYEHNEHLCGTTNDCDDFYKTWKE